MKSSPSTLSAPPQSATTSIDAAIRARIATAKAGSVFSPASFLDIGSRAAVDKVLSRMTASGELRRIARGLYDCPQDHPLLGKLLPSADEIARALQGKSSQRLQPSGAYAANLLGLSEQVPMKLAFLTDGASRTVQIGPQQILLKHTTPRNMATAGRISGLLIQAMRHLKRQKIDDAVINHLKTRLSAEDKQILIADAPLAPAWIADIMRRLASD